MLLEVSTTIGCPMKCSYCPQDLIGQEYDGPRLLSLETFIRSLENCPSTIPLSFAGYAEPYLNNQCSEMIGIAVSRLHKVQVYTTGVGMDDDDVAMLLRVQPYNFVLHMPDGNGDMKAKVTPDYVRRMKALQNGLKHFACTVFGTYHPALFGIIERNLVHHLLISRAGNLPVLAQIKKHGKLRCQPDPANENNVLIPTGELAICCCDYGLKHIIGNLLEKNWDTIHHSSQFLKFKGLMEEGDCICRSCEYAEVVE